MCISPARAGDPNSSVSTEQNQRNVVNEPDLSALDETAVAAGTQPPIEQSELGNEISELRAALDAAVLEQGRFRDEALRARAELDNVRKRAQRDVEAAHKFGMERFIEVFVPVKDSLDLGYDASKTAKDIDTLQEGIALTQQMFDSAFDKLGVQIVDPVGTRFDPARHQAMMTEPSSIVESGTVLRVMQKGYLLHDRLIRPAMVVVAKAPEGT
ncbi:MAG: nucleotide exchange factor GrpE [Gammaproteobacteria bacterium]|nr:nucleotide exchange factor GrpE [Gammaproteobacteria bacterium]